MKNKKLTKIFVAILSLALLVGAAIGITAGAEDAETYAIKSINVAHGDTTNILIAVDAPVEEAANIEVIYTFDGTEYVASYYKNVDIYNDGTEYPVFFTKGIGAKDCGQSVIAEAHKKGTNPAVLQYRDVSVAEYLFTKLYVEDYISATEGEDLEKRNLYVEFIEYISSAEEVLYNYKNPDTPRKLLNTRTFIYAQEAYVSQVGGNSGFVNGAVALDYTGTAENQVGWYVSTASGTDLVFGNVLNLTESATVKPCFIDSVMDFEDAVTGAGISTEWVEGSQNDGGQYTQSTTTVVDGDMNGIVPTYTAETDITNGRIATGGTYVLIQEDDAGNKYLAYKAVPRTNYSGYTGNRSNPPGFNIPVTDVDADANVTVWSFDAIFDGTCSGPAQIMFSGASNSIYPYIRGQGGVIKVQDSGGTNTLGTVQFNTYTNVRYEYYWNEGVTQVYINGVYCGSSTAVYTTHNKTTSISFNMDGSSSMGAMFDNMLAVNVKKTYVANPEILPVYETFSNGYRTETSEWNCTHSTYKSEIASGTFTYGQSTEGYAEDTVFTADNKYFASGVSSSYGTDAKVHNPTNDIETDDKGNNYLALVAPARISDRDRAYDVKIVPTKLDATHTTFVFDMDFRAVKGAFSFIVYTTAGKYAQFKVGTVDSVFAIGDAQICNYGEWASVRFVIDTANGTVSLYKLGANGEATLLSDNLTTISGSAVTNLTGDLRDISMQPSSNSELHVDNVALYTVE